MLRLRVLSAAILIPLVLIVIVAGQPWLTAGLCLIAALGAFEALMLIRRAGFPVQVAVGAAIAIMAVVEAALLVRGAGWGVLTAVGIIVSGIGAFAWRDPREGLRAWVATVFGALYVGLLAFAVRLVVVAPTLAPGAPLARWFPDGGRPWLLLMLFCVWAYDTGAYFAGRTWGRSRFLEHISPSKTWIGLLGGLAASLVVCALMLAAMGRPPIAALLLGPLIGLAAQAGDLAESMLKRAAGAKDSGELIPGHGGILDRIDSILFAAPVVYLWLITLDTII